MHLNFCMSWNTTVLESSTEPECPLQLSKFQNSSKRPFVVYVFPRETRSSGSNHRIYFFFCKPWIRSVLGSHVEPECPIIFRRIRNVRERFKYIASYFNCSFSDFSFWLSWHCSSRSFTKLLVMTAWSVTWSWQRGHNCLHSLQWSPHWVLN